VQPFRITCTTCQARLKVASPAAIGQILACPRCHSMVLVPTPDEAARAAGERPADPARSGGTSVAATTSEVPGTADGSNVATDTQAPSPAAAVDSSFDTIPAMLSGMYAAVPPPAAQTEPAAAQTVTSPVTGTASVQAEPLGTAGVELTDSPASDWTSPTELLWRNVAMWAVGGAAIVLLVGGALGTWYLRDDPTTVAGADSSMATSQADETLDKVAEPAPGSDPAASAAGSATPSNSESAGPHDTKADSAAVDPNDQVEREAESAPPSPSADPTATNNESPGRPGESTVAGGPTSSAHASAPADAAASDRSEATQQPEPTGQTNATAPADVPGPKATANEPVAPVPDEPGPAEPDPRDAPAWAMLREGPSEEPDVVPDPRAQLEMPLAGTAFPAISLLDFVRLVGDLANVPITLDVEALRRRSLTTEATISLSRQDVTAGQLLQDGLRVVRLAYRIEGDQIVVSDGDPSGAQRTTVNYRIDDLTGTSLAETGRLAEQIKRLVAPESWEPGDGDAIEVRAGMLRVEQMPPAQYEILSFCERLRLARGLPLRSRLAREWFPLESYRELLGEKLRQPITFTFDRPVALRTVVDHLENATGLTILVDWRSLASAGFSPRTQLTCAAKEEPLDRALTAILSALDLGWRAVDRQVLQIVSRVDAQRRHDIVFYDASELTDGGTSVDKLLSLANDVIERSGSSAADGAVQWDPPSKHLIVRHNQDAHDQIRAALVAQRNRTAGN